MGKNIIICNRNAFIFSTQWIFIMMTKIWSVINQYKLNDIHFPEFQPELCLNFIFLFLFTVALRISHSIFIFSFSVQSFRSQPIHHSPLSLRKVCWKWNTHFDCANSILFHFSQLYQTDSFIRGFFKAFKICFFFFGLLQLFVLIVVNVFGWHG